MTAQTQADLDALREWDREEHEVVGEWTRPDSIDKTIDRLRELLSEATVLPWRWHGQIGQAIGLRTVGHGVLYVMGATRQGMHGAQFTFWRRKPSERWGWNGDMEKADDVAVREVPYRNDVVDIDNPNARLIVAAVNAVPKLIDEIELLRKANAALASLAMALEPTGDHHQLPDGYCLDCEGQCIVPAARENTEAIRQGAYAGPSPFVTKGGAS